MRPVLTKLTPARGFSTFVHYSLLTALPVVVFVLMRLDFATLAFIMVILTKWRMFAVRPRFWAANIRANSVDIMFGVSMVIFIQQSGSALLQLVWAIVYGVWLIAIKPRSSMFWVSVQAGIAQFAALSALFLAWPAGPHFALSLISGLICYLVARHFIDNFDEAYARLLSYSWGYFAAALVWLCSHWLLNYQIIAQPTLILSAIGYGLAALYYLDHFERLNTTLRRQFVFIMVAIIVVILIGGLLTHQWGNKVI